MIRDDFVGGRTRLFDSFQTKPTHWFVFKFSEIFTLSSELRTGFDCSSSILSPAKFSCTHDAAEESAVAVLTVAT